MLQLLNMRLPDFSDGAKWQASHKRDGVETGVRPVVSAFACGIESGVPWARFRFTEDGGNHELRGTVSFTNGAESITFDSAEVAQDDVVLQTHSRGLKLRGSIEFDFHLGAVHHEYRFDTTLIKLL